MIHRQNLPKKGSVTNDEGDGRLISPSAVRNAEHIRISKKTVSKSGNALR